MQETLLEMIRGREQSGLSAFTGELAAQISQPEDVVCLCLCNMERSGLIVAGKSIFGPGWRLK